MNLHVYSSLTIQYRRSSYDYSTGTIRYQYIYPFLDLLISDRYCMTPDRYSEQRAGAPGSQQACLRQARARAFADQYFDRGSPARWPSFCAAVIFWHPITLDF